MSEDKNKLNIGSLFGGFGSFLSGLGSLGSGQRQERLMEKQYQMEGRYQRSMARHMWNNYNSPSAQRRGMEAAGVNPFVGDSALQPASVSANSSSPNLKDAPDPLGGFGMSMMQGSSAFFANQVTQNQAEVLKEQAEGVRLDNDQKRWEISIQPILTSIKNSEKASAEFKAAVDEFLSSKVEETYTTDKNQKESQTTLNFVSALNSLVSAAKTSKDREYVDLMIKHMPEVWRSQVEANDASAGLDNAYAQTESVLREVRKLNLESETDLNNAKKAVEEESKRLIAEDVKLKEVQVDLEKWIAERKKARKPTESYYQMALDIADRYLEYRGQNIQKRGQDKKSDDSFRSVISTLALHIIFKKFA